MSRALGALADVAAGRRPADGALLQNCALDGFGVRAFGREPILGLFRQAAMEIGDHALAVEGEAGLLVEHAGQALFADLYDGNLGRLWLIGGPVLGRPEPVIALARDLDLDQREGDLIFDRRDFAGLRADHAERLDQIARGLALPSSRGAPSPVIDAFSIRAIVIRAFSAGTDAAALLVLAGTLAADRRTPFTTFAALRLAEAGEPRVIVDQAGIVRSREAPWTPRF
ncbi:MAG: hypothetical protein H0X27_05730 [Caulobacteraceae bacterium]|nr:hypothetical protein [Caulobacteraceae bacterium]